MLLKWSFTDLITFDTCADIFKTGLKTASELPTGSLRTGTITPFTVILRPGLCLYQATLFVFDVSVIGPSETRYHTIVKICRPCGEFTGVDFSRV